MEFLRIRCQGARRTVATLNFLLILAVTISPRRIAGTPLPALGTEATPTTPAAASEDTPAENTTALRDFEVEGKWEIPDVSTYDALVERFSNGSEFLNYTAIVRWDNTCRKYVDYYYDTADLELTDNMNSLRHRTRYQASPPAFSNSWLDVKLANWVSDWDLIQYKGSPSRVGAIWGREEVGSRESEPDQPTSTAVISACDMSYDAIRVMKREHPRLDCAELRPSLKVRSCIRIASCDLSYDAIRVMRREHPRLDCAELRPSLKVDDYRLRIGLEDENNTKLFEVSLDRYILTDYLFNSWPFGAMEVEIEIAEDITEQSVRSLGAIAAALEEEFPGLRRSTYSKGGLFLPEGEGAMAGLMCGADGWPCSGDYTCVARGQRCDGSDDCSDGSDERQCPSATSATEDS
ncbi:Hypp1562 [Branchiostoma lanceolatum]|uniref:Hypp1562 protein n=1 Tax=Branchiostoma lanceolatum TaxID=7740 RepID=A0A8J9ZIY6_BRALA|nr:Hypp1562 [Branchiostoma lanceolatum]